MGIAVGASVAAIVLIAVGVWWALKRMRRNRSGLADSETTHFDGKAELPAVSEKRIGSSGQAVHEKSGQGLPAEIVNSPRYELEGSWHGHEMQDH